MHPTRHLTRRISAIVLSLAVLSSTLLVSAPAHAENGVSVGREARVANSGGDAIRIREGAGTRYDVKGSLAEGDKVWVLEGPVADGAGIRWYRVSFGSRVGWMNAAYLAGSGASSAAASRPASAAAKGTARVTNTGGDRIRYREGAGRNYDVKGWLNEGQQLAVLEGPVQGWYRVSVEGRIGWVDGQYLSTGAATASKGGGTAAATPSGVAAGGYARVANTNGDALRVRAQANGRVVASVAPGTVLSVKSGPARDNKGVSWYQVNGSGVSGWVMGNYLAKSGAPAAARPAAASAKPANNAAKAPANTAARTGTARGAAAAPQPPPAASARASGVVGTAMRYVGSRYRYAGTTPAGFDCSGFVYYVFNQAGISMPRAMMSQIARGTRIGSKDLQAGDLVYFSNTYKRGISHIGIYIGNGKMVHAGSYSTGVNVSDLWSPYWAAHYTGAVRIR